MKLDGMRRYPTSDIVDAVVIGTGAGGAPLLMKLAQAGLRVVAIEAGRNWDPADFPADEVTGAKIYWRDERLSGGKTPEAFGGNNSGTGVGGSMLHWGAFCPRPDPRDLKLRSTTGSGVDWPIEHAELVSYLEQVEAFIGVSGPSHYPWDPARRYAFPPVTLNASAHAMQLGCASLGITTATCPAAVLTRDVTGPAGDRQHCINCGHCHQGCRTGAKTSMDVTYLPVAVAAGAEIRAECFVHGIERDAAGRVTAVVYRDADGMDHKQRCAALFLCAGAVETPRLMLHTGIGNASGQVGRNYLAHVATQVWGTFEAEMRCNKGYPSSLITEDMIRPKDADFAGGYLVQSLGVLPVTWANQVARSRPMWGQKLIDYIDGYNHVAGIGINGDCLPSDDNLLTLSDEVDATGVPKPRIDFSYGANEKAMHAHSVRMMSAVWEAAGATDIWACPRVAHTIGTCRMGTDADSAVVDPVGRSHDVPNLWICDNSVFPSALPANPALTIMALSLRTAEVMLAGR
ncbi:MAG: GMC family oxidoreductase [Janthinobacterium lividum]